MRNTIVDHRRIAGAVADGAAVLAAISLPWSTSATAILVGVWVVASLPSLGTAPVRQECKTWHGGLPVLLLALASISILWGHFGRLHVGWLQGIDALRPLLKLLVIPFLIVQFRTSTNGRLVIGGYLVSCSALLIASLASLVFPIEAWNWGFKYPGVAVKNHIVQGEEFLLCGFALLLWAGAAFSQRFLRRGGVLVIGATVFLGAVLCVDPSRTELVVFVVLLTLLFYKRFGWKGLPAGFAVAAFAFTAAWAGSSSLRFRIEHFRWELQQYAQNNKLTSAGARLEFWGKSLAMIRSAPLIGHGAGTTRALFAADATGATGASAAVTDNPHNQILSVAIELGLLGAAALIAMWFAHARLFWSSTGAAWLGTLVVVENVVGSLFNSQIHDFTPGWTYVIGVGVLGGMALQQKAATKQLRSAAGIPARHASDTQSPTAAPLLAAPVAAAVSPFQGDTSKPTLQA